MKYYILLLISYLVLNVSCTKKTSEMPDVNTDNKFVSITSDISVPTFTSVCFFNENSGIVTTADGHIWKTEDGGISWADSAFEESNYLDKLYFHHSNLGFCSDGDAKTYQYKNHTWSAFNFPINNSSASSFCMLDDNHIYCTSKQNESLESYLIHTSDGGASWDTLFSNFDKFNQVLMLNESTGFILSHNTGKIGLFKTADGGKSWYGKIPSAFGSYFSGTTMLKKIIALDQEHLLAVGRGSDSNQGIILCSNDAGENWIITLTEYAINDICATQTEVFFVGDDFFVAQWTINQSDMDNALKITENWKLFDKERDFLLSQKGEPALHFDDIIQAQFIDDNSGFILTQNASGIFKIKLNPGIVN